jgi:hypothetical protein
MLEELRSVALDMSRRLAKAGIGPQSGKAATGLETTYGIAWRKYGEYRRLNGDPGYMNGVKR